MILNLITASDDSLDNVSLDRSTPGPMPGGRSLVIEVLGQIYLVALPAICITGVVGNALAFFIFVSKPMRRTSCSLYLATRSFADGGFLFATFVTWSSDASRLRFFHTDGICQITAFLTFIFAFLSVWMTVLVTCENFIRICRPFSVSKFCNVRIARICIFAMVLLSLLMYNYPLWTTYVQSVSRGNKTFSWCNNFHKYRSFIKWMSFWDLLITFVCPSLIIVVLMIFITASLVHSLKRQARLQGGQNRVQRSNGNTNQPNNRSTRSSNSPQAKVTQMLFAVSLLFILLNGPFHTIRTKMTVVEFMDGVSNQPNPSSEEIMLVVFQIIYYLSFGVNLLVYLTCGDNFRKVFINTYLKKCFRFHRSNSSNEMTAMTTVRLEDNEAQNEDQTALINHSDHKTQDEPTKGDETIPPANGKALEADGEKEPPPVLATDL